VRVFPGDKIWSTAAELLGGGDGGTIAELLGGGDGDTTAELLGGGDGGTTAELLGGWDGGATAELLGGGDGGTYTEVLTTGGGGMFAEVVGADIVEVPRVDITHDQSVKVDIWVSVTVTVDCSRFPRPRKGVAEAN
jgi:hypothetical protein